MAIFFKEHKKEINPLTAGAVGVVVGAAGAAAAYAMSNPKARKMFMERFNDVKNKTSEGIRYVMGKAHEMREKTKKTR